MSLQSVQCANTSACERQISFYDSDVSETRGGSLFNISQVNAGSVFIGDLVVTDETGAAGNIKLQSNAESDFTRALADTKSMESEAEENFEKFTQDNKIEKAELQASVKGLEGQVASLGKAIADDNTDLENAQKERDAARRRVSPTVAETLRLAVDALDETLQRSAYRWINLGELYGVAGVA